MTPEERVKLKIVVETQVYRQAFDGMQTTQKEFPVPPEVEDYYNEQIEGSNSGYHHAIIKIIQVAK